MAAEERTDTVPIGVRQEVLVNEMAVLPHTFDPHPVQGFAHHIKGTRAGTRTDLIHAGPTLEDS